MMRFLTVLAWLFIGAPAMAVAQDIEPSEAGTYTALKNANVRAQPSTGAAKVGLIPAGRAVKVTGKVRGANWFRVDSRSGGVGYVFGTLLAKGPRKAATAARISLESLAGLPRPTPAPDSNYAPAALQCWKEGMSHRRSLHVHETQLMTNRALVYRARRYIEDGKLDDARDALEFVFDETEAYDYNRYTRHASVVILAATLFAKLGEMEVAALMLTDILRCEPLPDFADEMATARRELTKLLPRLKQADPGSARAHAKAGVERAKRYKKMLAGARFRWETILDKWRFTARRLRLALALEPGNAAAHFYLAETLRMVREVDRSPHEVITGTHRWWLGTGGQKHKDDNRYPEPGWWQAAEPHYRAVIALAPEAKAASLARKALQEAALAYEALGLIPSCKKFDSLRDC